MERRAIIFLANLDCEGRNTGPQNEKWQSKKHKTDEHGIQQAIGAGLGHWQAEPVSGSRHTCQSWGGKGEAVQFGVKNNPR